MTSNYTKIDNEELIFNMNNRENLIIHLAHDGKGNRSPPTLSLQFLSTKLCLY